MQPFLELKFPEKEVVFRECMSLWPHVIKRRVADYRRDCDLGKAMQSAGGRGGESASYGEIGNSTAKKDEDDGWGTKVTTHYLAT